MSGFGLKSRMLSFTTDEVATEGTTKKHLTQSQSVFFILLNRGMPEVERRIQSFLTVWQTATPVNTKCPIKNRHHREPGNLHSTVHVIQQVLQGVSKLLSHRATVFFCFFLASSLGMWGRVQPHEAGRGGNVNVCLNGDEVSAFLYGCSIGVGRELWQARLLSSSIMGEDRVLTGRAGGAAGVRVVGGILVQRHWELQILLYAHRKKKHI